MCGIAGTVSLRRDQPDEELTRVTWLMANALAHRGPDDEGIWTDERTGIGLGHRRLSVIDPTPAGHQPMQSRSGRFVCSFNGEIYNHPDLRAQLRHEGVEFRSECDTEVFVEAIAAWGLDRALRSARGMWAFACFDRARQTVAFAVDRFGEKPLYVGWDDEWLYFGSQLKSVMAHPSAHFRRSGDALTAYFRHAYVPAPLSILAGVHKLPPATLLEVPIGRIPAWEPRAYWNALDAARSAAETPFTSTEEALETTSERLSGSVARQMVADVPLGAFLSGGIDSALCVALMRQHSRQVKTFTVAFADSGYDESGAAAAIARQLGTDHTTLDVSSSDALSVIPRLAEIYDEPFADSSQIPTTLLSSLTRRHVTVALTGDGGDELFAGYDRYRIQRTLALVGRVPAVARSAMSRVLTGVDVGKWDRMARTVSAASRSSATPPARVGERIHRFSRALTATGSPDAYRQIMAAWPEPGALTDREEPRVGVCDPQMWPMFDEVADSLRMLDLRTYLPGDILAKVDRASMAASLETRAPMLDVDVFESAWRIPAAMHRYDGRGKYILRSLLAQHLPPELITSSKRGFAVPIGSWLRGPLREWAGDLLTADALTSSSINPDPVLTAWSEHQNGARDWTARLWTILMWQAWQDHWRW